jgi:hypothetical protein
MVSENRVLRGIFRLGEEVTRGWRKLHNEKLSYFNSSPNVIHIFISRRVGRSE